MCDPKTRPLKSVCQLIDAAHKGSNLSSIEQRYNYQFIVEKRNIFLTQIFKSFFVIWKSYEVTVV